MIVIKSTFQDETSGMDIRGLGLAYRRLLWAGAGFCSETSRKSFLGVTANFCEFPVITEKLFTTNN